MTSLYMHQVAQDLSVPEVDFLKCKLLNGMRLHVYKKETNHWTINKQGEIEPTVSTEFFVKQTCPDFPMVEIPLNVAVAHHINLIGVKNIRKSLKEV